VNNRNATSEEIKEATTEQKLFIRLLGHLVDSILRKMEKKFKLLSVVIKIMCKELMDRLKGRFSDMGKMKEIKMIVMNGILFLRYIAPAIVSPERSGLEQNFIVCPPEVCKLLIEVAKVLLQIGIGKEFDEKDKNAVYNVIVKHQISKVEKFYDRILDVTDSEMCSLSVEKIDTDSYVSIVHQIAEHEKEILHAAKHTAECRYLQLPKLTKEQKKSSE